MPKHVREGSYILSKARTIPTSSRILNSIKPDTECRALVEYGGTLGSTIGYKLNTLILNNIYLTPEMTGILVGLILGDASIRRPGKKGQPQIQFNQGFVHLEYILYVSLLLSPLCTHFPALRQQRDGSFYLQLTSRCLNCLNPLYDLFIVNGVKTIPATIETWLSPIALAFWAMDDGSSTPEGFYLNTMSFSYSEQVILQEALLNRFGIVVKIHKHKNQFKLYIVASSMPKFRALVYPHFHDSMHYKLFPKSKG